MKIRLFAGVVLAIFAVALPAHAFTYGSSSIWSSYSGFNKNPSTITLQELGLLQLAAHDFFNLDRTTGIDAENGDLDLSTLLDHGYEFIALGGEARNRENIILFSVAKQYGERYLALLDRNYPESLARKKVMYEYQNDLRDIYKKLFGESISKTLPGEVTITENLALRTIHDLLPGHIKVGGEMKTPVDASLIGTTLTKKELRAPSGVLDGEFDPVFLNIVITIPPSTVIHIDLFERDSSLATDFGADHSFEYFMDELKDGSYDSDDVVMSYIRSLFSKGLYLN